MTPKRKNTDAPFWKKFKLKTSMKKLVYISLVLILIVSVIGYWFLQNIKPVSDSDEFVNFKIPVGTSATQIGNSLYKQGLIRNPLAFKIYTQFTGMSGSIQSGDYRLRSNFNLFQIVSQLSKAPLEIRVTIPEGLRREEIAEKFAKNLDRDQEFIDEFLRLSVKDEGRLFPDTYNFPNLATPGAIINTMKENYSLRTSTLVKNETSLSTDELLVMASLIERETKNGSERPLVAGILYNRLDAGWPLQIDATVQYALATNRCESNLACDWWKPITSQELALESPFNTYKNVGLPKSPIANPGLTALEAAYNPQESDYFFYLHDDSGQIHYARTLEEQNLNIDRYLR